MIITPVGAIFFTPSSIIGPRSRPCPASMPNTTGTRISATMGASLRVMIRVMNVATIRKPRMDSIGSGFPWAVGGCQGRKTGH